MFEQSALEKKAGRRKWTIASAMLAEIAILGVLVLLPLRYVQEIPTPDLVTRLTLPPPIAEEARVGGVVPLKAVIAKNGPIEGLTVISGEPMLIPSAMKAIKKWVYRPTYLNGQPTEVDTEIDFTFTLS